jgi:hypothetical protein
MNHDLGALKLLLNVDSKFSERVRSPKKLQITNQEFQNTFCDYQPTELSTLPNAARHAQTNSL